jgi:hypothetical protein
MSQELKDAYPSVDLAYNIAIGSYDALAKRLDSIDSRLQTMLALFATVTAAIPAVAANRGLSFHSWWFYIAIGTMALATVLTAIARLMGEVNVLGPSKLSDDVLAQSEWEFKNQIIRHAGFAFTANKNLVGRKWTLTVFVTILFFLGAGCMAFWVATAPHS